MDVRAWPVTARPTAAEAAVAMRPTRNGCKAALTSASSCRDFSDAQWAAIQPPTFLFLFKDLTPSGVRFEELFELTLIPTTLSAATGSGWGVPLSRTLPART